MSFGTVVTYGVLDRLLANEPVSGGPILEIVNWKPLDASQERLNLFVADGQYVARGLTIAGASLNTAVVRGPSNLLIQLRKWTVQRAGTTTFLLIQEAVSLGGSPSPVNVNQLTKLPRQPPQAEIGMTQAMRELPLSGHVNIAEAETQPGPCLRADLADNPYSRARSLPPSMQPSHAVPTAPVSAPMAASPMVSPSGGIDPGHTQASRAMTPSGNFQVLRSLNPYAGGRWKIKARVLTKSDIRKFNNSRGEGQLFKVDLKDQSGEMSATFFGRAVDKYHGMLKPGQVYTFTRGQVKTANKRYDTGDFVLTFEEQAQVEACEEDQSIPRIGYEFRPLCDVAALAPEALVDVKAVIYSVPPPFTFVAKTSNREMTKREIGLWDPSGPAGYSTMELTLWNESALGSDFQVGQVAFLKKARVTEFNQQKSLGSPAQLDLNPDHPDAFPLMSSFQQFQATNPLPVPVKTSSGTSSKVKTIEECRQEDLNLAPAGTPAGGVEKTVHRHSVVVTLTQLPTDRPPYYSACPQQVESNPGRANAPATRTCNKKTSQGSDGRWTCGGGHVVDCPDFRYMFRLNILDHTDQIEANLYDDVAKQLLQISAKEYMPLFEAWQSSGEKARQLQEIHQRMEWKKCVISLRSQKEMWQENERLRYSIESAQFASDLSN